MPTLDQAAQPTTPVLTWTSEELMQGNQEIVIKHGAERYLLKLTKNSRLILTK